jgi:hypothetical protein
MSTCILLLGVYALLFWSGRGRGSVSGWSSIRSAVAARRRLTTSQHHVSRRQSLSSSLSSYSTSTTPYVEAISYAHASDYDIQNASAAGTIASSFEPDMFDPWFSNRHVQTIGGFFLRDTSAAYLPRGDPVRAVSRILQAVSDKLNQSTTATSASAGSSKSCSSRSKFWNFRERIETPDGDWFHADTLFPTTKLEEQDRDTRVLLLHGLESNSDSALSHQMAASFAAQGMTVTCLNFRSCSQSRHGELILNEKLGFCESSVCLDRV